MIIFLLIWLLYYNYVIRNYRENRTEVIHLRVRERILALRLLEKQEKNTKLAKQVGIEVKMKEKSEK